jgi:lipopolysaccharide export system protein LptA
LGLTLAGASHTAALPEDADKPINIQADGVEVNHKSQRAVYRGSVQVDQGTLRVKADQMTVEYADQKVIRITFVGAPATYQQQLNADEGMVFANAAKIIYHTQLEKVDFQGDAALEQEGNQIAGELIKYDIVEGRIAADSGDTGPIRMTLQPLRDGD